MSDSEKREALEQILREMWRACCLASMLKHEKRATFTRRYNRAARAVESAGYRIDYDAAHLPVVLQPAAKTDCENR